MFKQTLKTHMFKAAEIFFFEHLLLNTYIKDLPIIAYM